MDTSALITAVHTANTQECANTNLVFYLEIAYYILNFKHPNLSTENTFSLVVFSVQLFILAQTGFLGGGDFLLSPSPCSV